MEKNHGETLPGLVNIQKAIENGHRNSEFSPLKIVIFHSYVKLPEGKIQDGPLFLIKIHNQCKIHGKASTKNTEAQDPANCGEYVINLRTKSS